MSSITEISDTACVNLNDAIVWIAFRIFPMTYFEPLDANTAELLKIIDCGNWVSNNNMYNTTICTTEICRKYNLPENIALRYIENRKEEPRSPDFIHQLLKNDDISANVRLELKKELQEATEYYSKSEEFDAAIHQLFEETHPKIYGAISSGKIRIYGVKFTPNNDEEHVSKIPQQNLLFNLFDFDNLELKTKDGKEHYGFLMVNLKDLLTEFEPQEITSAKVLNIGGEYVVSKDNRFSYSGRNSSLASEQIALLGMYVCELLTKEPKKPNKYYIFSSITWAEQKFHKKISETTMRSYLRLCLKK